MLYRHRKQEYTPPPYDPFGVIIGWLMALNAKIQPSLANLGLMSGQDNAELVEE